MSTKTKWKIMCGYLSISVTIIHILSYYILIDTYLAHSSPSDLSSTFLSLLFLTFILCKLLWIFLTGYFFMNHILEEFSLYAFLLLLVFHDFFPLTIFLFSLIIDKSDSLQRQATIDEANIANVSTTNETTFESQCQLSSLFLTSCSFLLLPWTTLLIIHLVVHSVFLSSTVATICYTVIILNTLSILISSSNFWQCISFKTTTYYALCCILDTMRYILTCFCLANLFHSGFAHSSNHTNSIWADHDLTHYSSLILAAKSLIVSPLYALTLFLFEFVNEVHEAPHNMELAMKIYFLFNAKRDCVHKFLCYVIGIPLIIIVYFVITVYLLLYLWLIADSVLFTYPLLLFHELNTSLWINSKGFDLRGKNKWHNVVKYMDNAINSYDYNLRLYLLNYLFFMLNKPKVSSSIRKKTSSAIKWYITNQNPDDPKLRNGGKHALKNSRQISTTYSNTTPNRFNSYTANQRYNSNPSTVHEDMEMDPPMRDEQKQTNEQVVVHDPMEWQRVLNLDIFRISYNEEEDEKHELWSLAATEYTRLLFTFSNDVLPFGGIFALNYNGFEWFLRDASPEIDDKKYIYIREFLLTHCIFPVHLFLNAYFSIIYPLLLAISIYEFNSEFSSTSMFLFVFIGLYYVLLIAMFFCMLGYLKFLQIWWLCLYRKTEHYAIMDQYLSPLYEYVNTHKLKIDLIQRVFGPLSLEILLFLGYYKIQNPHDTIRSYTPQQALPPQSQQEKLSTYAYANQMQSYLKKTNNNNSVGNASVPSLNGQFLQSSAQSSNGYGSDSDADREQLESEFMNDSLKNLEQPYIESSLHQSHLPDDENNPFLSSNVLPKPKEIHSKLLEFGYYRSDDRERGYDGNDFRAYKKIVPVIQNRSWCRFVDECNHVMLFPVDTEAKQGRTADATVSVTVKRQ